MSEVGAQPGATPNTEGFNSPIVDNQRERVGVSHSNSAQLFSEITSTLATRRLEQKFHQDKGFVNGVRNKLLGHDKIGLRALTVLAKGGNTNTVDFEWHTQEGGQLVINTKGKDGKSSKVEIPHDAIHIDQAFQQHNIDIGAGIATVLYAAVAKDKGFPSEYIQQAEALGAVAVADTPQGKSVILPHEGRMIRVNTDKAEIYSEDIADITGLLDHSSVQDLLQKSDARAIKLEAKRVESQNYDLFTGETYTITYGGQAVTVEAVRMQDKLVPLESIAESERLVPDNYNADVRGAVLRCFEYPYPEYPSQADRLGLTEEQIEEWKANGFDPKLAMGTPDNRPVWAVMDHSNRHGTAADTFGRGKGIMMDYDDTKQSFVSGSGKVVSAIDEENLHPYWEEILLDHLGVGGTGWNWTAGDNPAVDNVLPYISPDGHVYFLTGTRVDTGQQAHAGGMIDKEDPDASAALARELQEEFNISAKDVTGRVELFNGPCADPRDTLYAYHSTRAVLFLPTPEQMQVMQARMEGGDDIAKVNKTVASAENVDDMFAMHPELSKLAIRAIQERTGKYVVGKDGRLGVRPAALP